MATHLRASQAIYAIVGPFLPPKTRQRMQPRNPPIDEHESRAAVALTVAWMLMCLSTSVGVMVVLALELLMLAFPSPAGRHPLTQMSGVLLFVATTTGLLCLIFTPLALKVRQVSPPRQIVIGAILIGLAPLAILGMLALLRAL